jgi:hypothetical protein
MSIEAAIVEWARTRAAWQKTALRRLAAGEQIAEADFVAIADALCAGDQQPDDELKPEHISNSSAEAASIALLNVAELIGVNALVPGEKLSFGATGLTVVYGDNGCGKSGYARILKSMVSSRHRDQVLSNVFREAATLSASVTFSAGGTQTQVAWPGGHSDLTRVRFSGERKSPHRAVRNVRCKCPTETTQRCERGTEDGDTRLGWFRGFPIKDSDAFRAN